MPVALKASWTVVAGVIPGTPIDELSKQWLYTSNDLEEDRRNADDGKDSNKFTTHMKEAHDYAMQLNDPRRLNWARLEFIWY